VTNRTRHPTTDESNTFSPRVPWIAAITVIVACTAAIVPLRAEDSPPGAAAEAPVLTWPRIARPDGHEVVMFQPQLDEWKDHTVMTGKAAMAVTLKGTDKTVYGAAYLKVKTQADVPNHTVLFSDFRITDVHFPNADDPTARQCREIVMGIVPKQKTLEVSLDRVLASVERSNRQSEIEVNLAPPPIFRSEKPAVLVIFLGEPKLEQVKGTDVLFAANTNWDLFFDPRLGAYYLLNGDSWLMTRDLNTGPWIAATALPDGLAKLPEDENWQDVRKHVPGEQAKIVPSVFVSTTPAELILTDGPAQFQPVTGTKLLRVSNTESDLFMLAGEGGAEHYFLAAGRWFKAASLDGPWHAATEDLPAEFARIPEDSPCAHVLSSVSGTADADAAVLLASVPRKATVQRNDLTITVVYDGDPKFVLIDGMTLKYAVNTPDTVIRANGRYYCCHQAIWFVADSPTGPWAVATSVPQIIYTIPPTSPLHNVTYVYVYESTPTEVTVGHTSGYTGQYVANGLLMFGLGYWLGHEDDDDWRDHWYYHSYHYPSHYFSYGCGARFDYYSGSYVRGAAARVYGPYGGAGRWAAYNPTTGTYARGASRYGPRGSVHAREAYNPYTGRHAGRVTASNPYGSWGRSVVSGRDGWAQMGHRSGPGGAVGGFRTSEGAKGIVGEGNGGRTGGIAKDKHGDHYVGRDGNVYKRTDRGQWQKHTGDGWSDVSRATAKPRPTQEPTQRPTVKPSTKARPATTSRQPSHTSRSRSAAHHSKNVDRLHRDFEARRRGQQRSSRFQQSRSSSRSSRSTGRSRGRRR